MQFGGKTNSLTPSLFIEVPVPSQQSEWSCICVLGVAILPLSKKILLEIENVPTVCYFLLCFSFHSYSLITNVVIFGLSRTICFVSKFRV